MLGIAQACQVIHFPPLDPANNSHERPIKGGEGKGFLLPREPRISFYGCQPIRRGQPRRRESYTRIWLAGLPFVRRRSVTSGRANGRFLACRLIRSAARIGQSTNWERSPDGRERQDVYRRFSWLSLKKLRMRTIILYGSSSSRCDRHSPRRSPPDR